MFISLLGSFGKCIHHIRLLFLFLIFGKYYCVCIWVVCTIPCLWKPEDSVLPVLSPVQRFWDELKPSQGLEQMLSLQLSPWPLIVTLHPWYVLILSEVSLEVRHQLFFTFYVDSEKQQTSPLCCCFSDFPKLNSDCYFFLIFTWQK